MRPLIPRSLPAGIQAKLDRAYEHMDALQSASDAFLETEPYTLSRQLDADGREHVYVFSKYTEPPLRISTIVGDAVHNLRTTLDHMVLALAQAGAKADRLTMSAQAETGLQFPITGSSELFNEQIRRNRLRFIKAEAKALIESVQPYNTRPSRWQTTVLAVLKFLDDRDKHRNVPVIGSAVSFLVGELPPGVARPAAHFMGGWGPNAEVVRYVFDAPHPEVDINLGSSFRVIIEGVFPLGTADDQLRNYAQWLRREVLEPLSDYL